MPGLVGFYAFGEGRENWDAPHFIHYGLSALQGRGQESVSLAAIGPAGTLHTLGGKGGVEEFFRNNKRSVPKGFLGIGQTSSYTDEDRKSTRLNSSHVAISYAVFCLKKKN